jgi:hypothetical protein
MRQVVLCLLSLASTSFAIEEVSDFDLIGQPIYFTEPEERILAYLLWWVILVAGVLITTTLAVSSTADEVEGLELNVPLLPSHFYPHKGDLCHVATTARLQSPLDLV